MDFRQRIGLLTATAIMTGALLISGGCAKKGAEAPPQMPPPEVGVITIKTERVTLTTELPGRTSAFLVAEVRPQVGGIILKRLFTEGGVVKAGDVLYQIDPSMYQAAYASAKAALGRAEANVVPLKLKTGRYARLADINAVSKQDADDVSAQLKQAEADVETAKAALELARINLAYTAVKAPISGRIGRSSVTNGALVTASQPTPLATIQELDRVYVDVTQSAAEMLQLKQNLAHGRITKDSGSAKVEIILEDGTKYPLAGRLEFSDVTVDPTTGTVDIRTVFPNPRGVLLPGLFVRAVLEEGVNSHAILVPQRGVSRNTQGEAVVLVVGADEKVEPRTIKVERTVGDDWLVNDGLKVGDRVILDGTMKARPGSPVKAVPFGSVPDAPNAGSAKPAAAKK